MTEERYWFEEVPEEQRYWVLVHWGMSPKREAEWAEGMEDLELPDEFVREAREIEQDEHAAKVFGITPEKSRKIRRDARATKERMDAIGYAPGVVSDAWWSGVEYKWIHAAGREHVEAPSLWSTKEAAEKVLLELKETEPEAYLSLVESYGEKTANEAFHNTPPLKTVWVDRDTLLESLREAEFLCVMVDGRLRLREDFIEELQHP
jgi:hypothetical protein